MALLSLSDRATQWAEGMRKVSDAHEAITASKPDLLAATGAIDDWIEANALSFNAAIPLPARTQLTVKQKARLLMLVLQRRFEVA